MAELIHNLVGGTALALMLALLVGLVLAKGYQIASRQLSRGGMIAFLIVCGVATVKAQKTFRVGSDFATIQEAFDFLNCKQGDSVEIIVAPGTYSPVDLTDFYFRGKTLLTPTIRVMAEGEPGSVIIDGGGVNNAITTGSGSNFIVWNGLVLSNAVRGVAGVVDGSSAFSRCIATCCQIGFENAYLEDCLAYGNSCIGAVDSSVVYSTVVDNHGYSDAGAAYAATGVTGCWVNHSIVWGNTKDGKVANIDADSLSFALYNCTDPLIVSGGGNICADPQFVNSENRDYHLRMGSPCINAGEAWLWGDPDPDFDGNPRIQRGIRDIGAYEFQPTNDTQTITAPVPVEFAWVDEKCPDVLTAAGGDYDKAVLRTSANPIDMWLPEGSRSYYSIWQSYLLDLDPTDSNATWYATIRMVDGVPVVGSEPKSPNRKYTNLGKHALTDEVWSAACEAPRFFKVKVELK